MSELGETLSQLVDAYMDHLRAGIAPSVEEFANAHPAHAAAIRELFPTLRQMEAAGSRDDHDDQDDHDNQDDHADHDETASGPPDAGDGDGAWPQFPGMTVLEEVSPGVGGMGTVYKARDQNLARTVAIKTVQRHLDTPEGLAFFATEARAAARLDHPNLVAIYSFHPDHAPPYSVMPFVEGEPLDAACAPLPAQKVAALFARIADALHHAHANGIAHRDIKPANILISADGTPRVLDFGLARHLDAVLDEANQDGATLRGTPHYLAPEVFLRVSDGGPAADLYALGVTLYVTLTGARPYTANDLGDLKRQVLEDDPRLPKDIDPAVPEPLQRICLKAMERDPKLRYPSAAVMAEDLRRFADGREVFARPSRYLRDRAGRFQNHITEIQLWHEQELVDRREADQLARPYKRLRDAESPWDELSRRFPIETVAMQVGGWVVLVSSLLWLIFYWKDLGRAARVAALGVPCVGMNLAGAFYKSQRSRFNAIVFFVTGCLLVPLFLGVLLTEYELLRWPQAPTRELFEQPPIPDRLAEPGALAEPIGEDAIGFVPTNAQIAVALAGFLAYALLLLSTVRARVFAAWSGVGVYLGFSAALLLLGLKEWVSEQHVARALSFYLPVCVAFAVIGRQLAKRRSDAWGAVWYAFFPLPFALVMTLLAYHGGREYYGAEDWDARPVQLWAMANGVVYFLLSRASVRARAGFVRSWGEVLLLLLPISLLVPLNVLFEESPVLFDLSGVGFTLFELFTPTASLVLLFLGTYLRRHLLSLSGAIGLSVFLWRVTVRHFQDTLTWPLILASAGALTMVAGGIVAYLRGRSTRPT